ncbi:MAG TPA: ABC transporter substrate-binding protein [Stellaceae bacterium]|nr:ABC transporter substrate-binding protein [Stellaceae bacterium]
MRRRDFIAVLGGTLAWPLTAGAQQPERTRLVGVLMGFAETDATAQSMVAAFRDALQKLGWTEGGNLRIELRWGGYDRDRDRIKTLAKEVVDRQPDAILGQTTPVIGALSHETRTIPIVFVTVSDPISSGFAANLAHPGGNITGFTVENAALGGKWVQLLKEIAPGIGRVALLYNPTGPSLEFFLPSIQTAASSLDIQVSVATVHAKDEIEGVIAAQARDPVGGLIVMPGAFNNTNRDLTSALAARYGVPAIYFATYFAQSGGLIAYGTDYAEQFRQAAGYIDSILRGTKPADLPVQAPTKFELVINLKAAKAIGITVPPSLLAAPTR